MAGGHQGSASGSSGSSSWRLSWVGPRRRVATSAAASSSARCASTARSKQGAKTPKMPFCRVVWLAPVPRMAAGRSAVRSTRRRPECAASMTAGSRFPTAVPDVVTTATGVRDPAASPRARNPADRSSTRTCSRTSPAASAAYSGDGQAGRARAGAEDHLAHATRDQGGEQTLRALRGPHVRSSMPAAPLPPATRPRRPTRASIAWVGDLPARASDIAPTSRPRLVAAGGRLPDLPAQLRRRERRRHRRPPRDHRPRRPPGPARRRRRVAQPVLPVGPGRRRLRRRRLPGRRRRSSGTLDDFDELVSVLHGAGIKLIVDIVPNHTSNRHAWFREALASPPGSAARDRYVIRRGNGPDGAEPPTDWRSFFGGPAWEPIGDGDWYLHLFAPEQPDLNWALDEVREDFLTTLRFWSDRGVDGFRIDVAHLLVKDASVIGGVAADLPTQERIQAGFPDGRAPVRGPRRGARDLPDLARRCSTSTTRLGWPWPRPGSPPTAGSRSPDRRVSGRRSTSTCSSRRGTRRRSPRSSTENLALAAEAGASSTWVFSNHDMVRHVTRYAVPNGTDLVAWLRERWSRPGAGPRARPAPGPGSDAAGARAPGLDLPLPGRGAGPARGDRPAGGRAPGPDVRPDGGRREGPRRLPGPAARGPRRGSRSGSARAPPPTCRSRSGSAPTPSSGS